MPNMLGTHTTANDAVDFLRLLLVPPMPRLYVIFLRLPSMLIDCPCAHSSLNDNDLTTLPSSLLDELTSLKYL